MNVRLSLHATLRKKRRDLAGGNAVETAAASVGELLDELGLTEEEAAIVFVNEKRAGFASVIQDGDHIRIFPILGGG